MKLDIDKIERLWQFLKIQDETLAIRFYDHDAGRDRYAIVRDDAGRLTVTVSDDTQVLDAKAGYTIIHQRGIDGKSEIPDPIEIQTDMLNDY